MAIRQRLFLFSAGMGMSLLGALALRDGLLVNTQRHLEDLDVIEKDIRGEVHMRKDPPEFSGLLRLIKESYVGKWVRGVEKTVNP